MDEDLAKIDPLDFIKHVASETGIRFYGGEFDPSIATSKILRVNLIDKKYKHLGYDTPNIFSWSTDRKDYPAPGEFAKSNIWFALSLRYLDGRDMDISKAPKPLR